MSFSFARLCLIVASAIQIAATVPQAGKDDSRRKINVLDEAGVVEMAKRGGPHVIKVNPKGCQRAPGTCNPLDDWWAATADAFSDGRVWSLSCEASPGVCESALSVAVPPGREPLFEFSTDGRSFQRYRGPPSPLAVLEAIETLYANADAEGDWAATGDTRRGEASREQREAAMAGARAEARYYLQRRETLRKAEGMLKAGNVVQAQHVLVRYLEDHPTHPNALIMSAEAARAAGNPQVAADMWRRALKVEPLNAHLHAGAAAALMEGRQYEEAYGHLGHALKAPRSSDDGISSEEDRAVLRRMRKMCKEQRHRKKSEQQREL